MTLLLLLIAAVWLITAVATVALCAAAAQGDREITQVPAVQRPTRARTRTWVRGSARTGARVRQTHV